TEEEVEKYITQIAFSGAEDFLNKYQDKMDKDQIIGHFGLGFYSSFMIADTVDIDTCSYTGSKAVHWTCDGGTTYDLTQGTRLARGTDIILHVNEESKDFLNYHTLSSTIEKYCNFMPVPIYVIDANKEEEPTKEGETPEVVEPKPVNDPVPLYTKKPSECTDEAYKAFYSKTFMDYNEPLFWIHLDMDYPFNLKGILYFPKLHNEYEMVEGKIKLYNNQVFVADNIKEVIPEFLLLLKGIIDCPDIPLNVSRSFLQNDGFVKKISDYITKKVADKLISLYKKEIEHYESCWDSISPFIKYGCLREEKFADKMNDYILYKTTEDTYITLKDYLEKVKDTNENKVFYVSDKEKQSQYVSMFKENGLSAVYLNHPIDSSFISHAEMKNKDVHFMRIDADISSALKQDGVAIDTAQEEKLGKLFGDILNQDKLKVKLESLKSTSVPSMLLISEESRRMQEMMKLYGMDTANLPANEATLVLNENHPLITTLAQKDLDAHTQDLVCHHLYDLALISNQTLSAEAMQAFLQRNNELLMTLLNK
ncbi:MAG: molecular chaperone HtpG, partial [Niameybacter sp.]